MELDSATRQWVDRSRQWWQRMAHEHQVPISTVMSWEIRPEVRAVLAELIASCDEAMKVVDGAAVTQDEQNHGIIKELHARDILLHSDGVFHVGWFGIEVAAELGITDRPQSANYNLST